MTFAQRNGLSALVCGAVVALCGVYLANPIVAWVGFVFMVIGHALFVFMDEKR